MTAGVELPRSRLWPVTFFFPLPFMSAYHFTPDLISVSLTRRETEMAGGGGREPGGSVAPGGSGGTDVGAAGTWQRQSSQTLITVLNC